MIYKILIRQKEKNGLTEDLMKKIDVFYASGKITDKQYNELIKFE